MVLILTSSSVPANTTWHFLAQKLPEGANCLRGELFGAVFNDVGELIEDDHPDFLHGDLMQNRKAHVVGVFVDQAFGVQAGEQGLIEVGQGRISRRRNTHHWSLDPAGSGKWPAILVDEAPEDSAFPCARNAMEEPSCSFAAGIILGQDGEEPFPGVLVLGMLDDHLTDPSQPLPLDRIGRGDDRRDVLWIEAVFVLHGLDIEGLTHRSSPSCSRGHDVLVPVQMQNSETPGLLGGSFQLLGGNGRFRGRGRRSIPVALPLLLSTASIVFRILDFFVEIDRCRNSVVFPVFSGLVDQIAANAQEVGDAGPGPAGLLAFEHLLTELEQLSLCQQQLLDVQPTLASGLSRRRRMPRC